MLKTKEHVYRKSEGVWAGQYWHQEVQNQKKLARMPPAYYYAFHPTPLASVVRWEPA